MGRGMGICVGFALAVGVAGVSGGCEANSMDKDLKRQADRATLLLNQTENERDAAKAEADKAKQALELRDKQMDAASKEYVSLRERMARTENELMAARQRIRELEEAALAARQGMPTTRAAQP